jgi:hypothetical protein
MTIQDQRKKVNRNDLSSGEDTQCLFPAQDGVGILPHLGGELFIKNALIKTGRILTAVPGPGE